MKSDLILPIAIVSLIVVAGIVRGAQIEATRRKRTEIRWNAVTKLLSIGTAVAKSM